MRGYRCCIRLPIRYDYPHWYVNNETYIHSSEVVRRIVRLQSLEHKFWRRDYRHKQKVCWQASTKATPEARAIDTTEGGGWC